MSNEYPTGFLAGPDDNRNVAESRLLLSFENTYRGPSCVETNRESREWKSDAGIRGLRSGVRFHGGYKWPIYQDLIEVVPQK